MSQYYYFVSWKFRQQKIPKDDCNSMRYNKNRMRAERGTALNVPECIVMRKKFASNFFTMQMQISVPTLESFVKDFHRKCVAFFTIDDYI